MPLDLHTTAAARLREDEQRYTSNRRALVDVLAAADQPLTIPQVLERRSDLAQSSAYRNLAVNRSAGPASESCLEKHRQPLYSERKDMDEAFSPLAILALLMLALCRFIPRHR